MFKKLFQKIIQKKVDKKELIDGCFGCGFGYIYSTIDQAGECACKPHTCKTKRMREAAMREIGKALIDDIKKRLFAIEFEHKLVREGCQREQVVMSIRDG